MVSGFVGYSIGKGGVSGEGASVYGITTAKSSSIASTGSTGPADDIAVASQQRCVWYYYEDETGEGFWARICNNAIQQAFSPSLQKMAVVKNATAPNLSNVIGTFVPPQGIVTGVGSTGGQPTEMTSGQWIKWCVGSKGTVSVDAKGVSWCKTASVATGQGSGPASVMNSSEIRNCIKNGGMVMVDENGDPSWCYGVEASIQVKNPSSITQ